MNQFNRCPFQIVASFMLFAAYNTNAEEFLQFNQYNAEQQTALGAMKPRDTDVATEVEDGPQGPPRKTGWNFEAGAGVMYGPAYEGSDKFRAMPLPTLAADYEDGLFFANIFDGIGSYPIQTEDYKIGASIGYAFGRDESDDRNNLRGMGDIDMSPTASLMGEYSFGPITVSGKLTQGNDDYGMVAEADVGMQFPINDQLMVMAKIGTTWGDDDHMISFFGVSSKQSARSGYRRYEADSGIKSFGLDIGAFYSVTSNVDVMLMLSADQLVDSAADSPIVKEEFQPAVFLSASYKF